MLQNPSDQLFGTTVEEDVAFGPRNLGLPETEVQERLLEALDAVAAVELRTRAIHHLSFGEQKRVAMAGVLAMKPSILILDEPTAGLDPAGRRPDDAPPQPVEPPARDHGHPGDPFGGYVAAFCRSHLCAEQRGGFCAEPADEVFGDHEMLSRASLRLPYISTLLHEMKRYDGVPINGLPLTVGEARKRLLELIPEELIVKQMRENSS